MVHVFAFDHRDGKDDAAAARVIQQILEQIAVSPAFLAPIPEVVMGVDVRQFRFDHILHALINPGLQFGASRVLDSQLFFPIAYSWYSFEFEA